MQTNTKKNRSGAGGKTPLADRPLNAILTPAIEGGFVALDPETGTCSQGETAQAARANLQEAVTLYLEECPAANTPAKTRP